MGWTWCIIGFLFVSVCECWRLPRSKPVMHGEVQSPQYPRPYPPSQLKQWDLQVPEGYQIQLTFTHLDIEASTDCFYDSLTVLYDQNILGKFCGQQNSTDGHHPGNQPILFPGNKLTLVFQTDDINPELHQNIGFSVYYQAIDMDECSEPDPADGSAPPCSQICLNTPGSYLCSCHHGYELRTDQRTCVLSCGGGIFDEPEGHLTSPGYPDQSPHDLSCQYIVSVEPGFTVTLNFTDNFHIESIDTDQGPTCLYHWLQVTIPEREPMKLCGGESPGLMITESNTVRLDYHTDGTSLSHGWSLNYNTHRVKCPSPGVVAKGRVTPVLPEYLYRDYFYVRCDEGYKLMMDGRELVSFSNMCKSNGQWHFSLPKCQIIDCGEPEPLLNGGVTFISGSQNQYRSVIQYHCNEPFYSLLGGVNVSYTCAADRKWSDNNDIHLAPKCIPVCGKPTKPLGGFQRILGGATAPENTIPWQVMLEVNGGRGGGIVIGDHWVMTAAHNLVHNDITVEVQKVQVYMGSNDVELMKTSPVDVASLHVHPKYKNPNNLDFNNDIALIKLQHPLKFNSSIMPICLPAEGVTYTAGLLGMVSGFGLMESGRSRMATNNLMYVQIDVVEQEVCRESINEAKKIYSRLPSLTDNMFCAGDSGGGKDSCQGDSGGPLAIKRGDQFWAAGIVSWGIDCGQKGTYGVYTKVANYLGWIINTMQEN